MNSFPAELFPDFVVVSIPTTTNFRGVTRREIALFTGSEGWSEFSAFPEYDDLEAATWLKAALAEANTPWPELHRKEISINATLPIVEVDRVKSILDKFDGAKTVKIKINDFAGSVDVVEEVLELIPGVKIRLDVNGGWTLDEALLHLYDFHLRFGSVFDYVEQPCESLNDLAALKKEIPMRIAVDESIRKNLESDLESLHAIADIAILKWAPSGGIAAAREIIERIKLPVVVSSALDSGIGISHGLALAASLDQDELACGLGTVALLESDLVSPATLPHHGFIDVKRREPSKELIEKYRADADRTQWWKNRITRIVELGGVK